VATDLARLGPIAELDFSCHVLDRVELHECNYNWKTFVEVYLEDYHVGPLHPGLGSFVACEDLRWEFGDNYCVLNVVEFYYPEEIAAFEREFVQAQQAAYMETCDEDDEIALRMDAGRRALIQRGVNESGPYQSPMEDGMQHFHEWYRGVIGADALDNDTMGDPT